MLRRKLILTAVPPALQRRQMSPEAQRAASESLARVWPTVLDRSAMSCEYCGYEEDPGAARESALHSAQPRPNFHLRAGFLDQDVSNVEMSNVVTCCYFCWAANNLGADLNPALWAMVRLPEVSQAQVSHMARAAMLIEQIATEIENAPADPDLMVRERCRAYCVMVDGFMLTLQAEMRKRATQAEELIGTADPLVLGQLLVGWRSTKPELHKRRDSILAGIRLVPVGLLSGNWEGMEIFLPTIRSASQLRGFQGVEDVVAVARQAHGMLAGEMMRLG